jgi:MFS family permease
LPATRKTGRAGSTRRRIRADANCRERAHYDRPVRRSLIATCAGFLALGLFWGAWAAVLPGVREATGASNGGLGLALLFVTVGSIPAMLLVAGPAVDRYGTRAVAVAGGAFALAVLLPGLAKSLPGLAVALLAAGAASGALDVGINARITQLEDASGRRLMPAAHGIYSVGVLAGAVGAGFARGAGVHREWILAAVAVAVAAAAVAIATDPAPAPPGARSRPRFERALLALGLVAAAAFVVEGGIESWSALFLETELDAEPQVSGLGPGVFGAAMALGRFGGQAATRIGDRALFAGGAAVAAAGCAVAAAAPTSAVALVGLMLAGLGISAAAPVAFGAAGRGRADAAAAVATVTTLGYLGLLVGPPLVGGIAEAASLRVSFAALACVAVLVAAAAARLRL